MNSSYVTAFGKLSQTVKRCEEEHDYLSARTAPLPTTLNINQIYPAPVCLHVGHASRQGRSDTVEHNSKEIMSRKRRSDTERFDLNSIDWPTTLDYLPHPRKLWKLEKNSEKTTILKNEIYQSYENHYNVDHPPELHTKRYPALFLAHASYASQDLIDTIECNTKEIRTRKRATESFDLNSIDWPTSLDYLPHPSRLCHKTPAPKPEISDSYKLYSSVDYHRDQLKHMTTKYQLPIQQNESTFNRVDENNRDGINTKQGRNQHHPWLGSIPKVSPLFSNGLNTTALCKMV